MKFIGHIVAALIVLCMLPFSTAAFAAVSIIVDKSSQTMHVYENGDKIYTWNVSTGKYDSWTPNGTFGVQSLSPDHKSSIYNNAPMPWSIFFNGDIAIHGTTEVSMLGQRDSHGCVRLDPKHAKVLFRLVEQVGEDAVSIKVRT